MQADKQVDNQADHTPNGPRRLLIVQVAGLGLKTAREAPELLESLGGLECNPLEPPFPAVTSTAQATFRTASDPQAHGIVANGWFDRVWHRTTFWEQSADLVAGPRIWDAFRARGRRVAMLFWQQSLGESVDQVLSPAPIHKHGGGMIDSCYSLPDTLYNRLVRQIGAFRLRHYWGPLATPRSSRWIARATASLLAGDIASAPDLCLTYLPALDYDLQRYGPHHRLARLAVKQLAGDLRILRAACEANDYGLLVWGDYAISTATQGALFPNRILNEAGLLRTRLLGGRRYPDLHASRAFACVDHQIAHVYVRDTADIPRVRELLAPCGEVRPAAEHEGLDHARAGDLVITAPPGAWLAYPWWLTKRAAPDYAGHVDIHNKPGYDPCELFWGWPPGSVSLNPERLRGVHGITGTGHEACWFSDMLPAGSHTLRSLAEATRSLLETLP
jgi:predicted AlkP superfamily pyrophosphatase or phosphodiesterase